MKKNFIKLCVNAVSLVIVAWIVPGISIKFWPAAVLAALVIIILNAFLRPVLLLLTWPLTFLTLGFFTLFVNGLIFFIAARVVSGFDVSGVWTACFGALLMSIVNFILDIFLSFHGNMRFQIYNNGRGNSHEGGKRYNDVIDAEIKEEK